MQSEMELFTERTSLLDLNDYCLLEIFEFLELGDAMNLAECCNRLRRIADRAVKIKSKIELNGNMFAKLDNYIDRVLTHIGHNVSWLTIRCDEKNPNLSKIISDCSILKSLQIRSWHGDECEVGSTVHNFDKIELLSLASCDLGKLKMFLKNFYKLKFLTIGWCWKEDDELITTLINNNPEMESLCYIDLGTYNDLCIFQLLERIPKVKSLNLDIFCTLNAAELNSLLTLNALTKLRLCCGGKNININNVLSGLARKGIMEEMELYAIEIDDTFFDILKSFVRLQLLAIQPNGLVKSSTIWPTNLKWLRLEKIEFAHLNFISTMQQLKSLEYMDIQRCTIAESDVADFKNVTKLSRNILNVMGHGNRKQQLEVVLPIHLLERDDSKTHLLVDSKPLRILLTTNFNPFKIEIHFPGLPFNP